MRRQVAELNRGGAALWMLCGLASPMPAAVAGDIALPPSEQAAEMHSPADAAAAVIDFDIPAQALTTALDRFSVLSGRSALFSSALTADRVSSPVSGRHTPRAALQLLLEGTGLTVEEISAGQVSTFVLKPVQADPNAPDGQAATLSGMEAYDGLIQARVWEGICADARTASGSYRSLLRFQVDAAGHVFRPRLLSSSGDRRRDGALIEILQGIQVGQRPPPDMPQPVTMLILPDQAGGPVCSDGRH